MTTESSNIAGNRKQFACLYTTHKTRKRKVWHDGRLVVHCDKAILYDAHPPHGSGDPSLGECPLSRNEVQGILGKRLETERYWIDVEGHWTQQQQQQQQPTVSLPKRSLSSSMKKLMTTKFQKPKAYIPPPSTKSQMERVLGKRRRPLQPGEWMAMHNRENGKNTASHSQLNEISQTHLARPPSTTAEDSNRFAPIAFAKNDFDATSYYGMEDKDSQECQAPFNDTVHSTDHNCHRNESSSTQQYHPPNHHPDEESETDSDLDDCDTDQPVTFRLKATSGEETSGNKLLALFGRQHNTTPQGPGLENHGFSLPPPESSSEESSDEDSASAS